MKIIKSVVYFFQLLFFEHLTLPIRMVVVYEIIRYLYMGSELNFKDELNNAISYFFIFAFVYGITVVLDIKRAESSPLMLSNYIEETIKDDYRIKESFTSNESRGLFKRNMTVVGITVNTEFVPHDNPSQIFEVSTSYLRILEGMQLPSHQLTIERMERLRDESSFMIRGK